MSEEFDPSTGSETTFTAFIPLAILLSGFIIWFGFQDYELNVQRSALNRQFNASLPTISEAQQINARYVALMKDLVQTAASDDNAKAIVNDAIKVGLLHEQPGTNAPGTPAPPAPSK